MENIPASQRHFSVGDGTNEVDSEIRASLPQWAAQKLLSRCEPCRQMESRLLLMQSSSATWETDLPVRISSTVIYRKIDRRQKGCAVQWM